MKHIRKQMQGTQWVAWCGTLLWNHDWKFQSIDHAVLTILKDSVVGDDICQDCLGAARSAINGAIGKINA
jgi:hypothetical protein